MKTEATSLQFLIQANPLKIAAMQRYIRKPARLMIYSHSHFENNSVVLPNDVTRIDLSVRWAHGEETG